MQPLLFSTHLSQARSLQLKTRRKKTRNFAKMFWRSHLKTLKHVGGQERLTSPSPDYCRPLVIKMKNEQLANEWTKDGKGHKTANGHWINKDLCAADRKANFLSREERRKRTQKKSN